jgi:hypothetical protein
MEQQEPWTCLLRTPVSLAFQGEVSRSCITGKHVAPSSCVSQEAGFYHKVKEPGLNGDFRDKGSGVLSCKLFFLFFVVSCFSICGFRRALLLTGYGTLWVSFRVP